MYSINTSKGIGKPCGARRDVNGTLLNGETFALDELPQDFEDLVWGGGTELRTRTQDELDGLEQEKEDSMAFDNVLITIAKALHNHENRIRELEGKQPVTLRQLIKALRQL